MTPTVASGCRLFRARKGGVTATAATTRNWRLCWLARLGGDLQGGQDSSGSAGGCFNYGLAVGSVGVLWCA